MLFNVYKGTTVHTHRTGLTSIANVDTYLRGLTPDASTGYGAIYYANTGGCTPPRCLACTGFAGTWTATGIPLGTIRWLGSRDDDEMLHQVCPVLIHSVPFYRGVTWPSEPPVKGHTIY